MKKTIILGIIILGSLTACSSTKKNINGVDQTFTDYVLLNKHYDNAGEVYDARVLASTSPEMFPGLRLKKWLETE